MTQEGSKLALAGMRVIEFSNLLPGAWCTQMLGDLGAEVIKVERSGTGDPSRHNPPFYVKNSIYFNTVNRNKLFWFQLRITANSSNKCIRIYLLCLLYYRFKSLISILCYRTSIDNIHISIFRKVYTLKIFFFKTSRNCRSF